MSTVTVERDGAVAAVILPGPALNTAVKEGLRTALQAVADDSEVRAVVFGGTGRAFCVGQDLKEHVELLNSGSSDELFTTVEKHYNPIVSTLANMPKPVIAAVNGVAAGAGSVIALAADFRLLAESASFAFLFTRVGLSGADMGSAYLLPRIVGLGRATELLMLGDKVDARRALEIGLANEVVPDAELRDRVAKLAKRLADGPALAYSATKAALIRELDSDLGTSIEMEALTQALLMKSEDFNEFYNAWHEGRKPDWRGR